MSEPKMADLAHDNPDLARRQQETADLLTLWRWWREGMGYSAVSPRLLDVAELVAKGASNKRIAKVLRITENTAEKYLEQLFRAVPGPGKGRVRVAVWWAVRNLDRQQAA